MSGDADLTWIDEAEDDAEVSLAELLADLDRLVRLIRVTAGREGPKAAERP